MGLGQAGLAGTGEASRSECAREGPVVPVCRSWETRGALRCSRTIRGCAWGTRGAAANWGGREGAVHRGEAEGLGPRSSSVGALPRGVMETRV